MSQQLKREALNSIERGWRVFPLAPRSKGPMRGSNGYRDASLCPDQIARWWTKTPEANVGLATGAVSGVVVLDVDLGHGGIESLAQLEAQHGPLPRTVETTTGGGGRHLYFNHPGGIVKNSAGTIGAGLDVRGDGGSVVLPPSIHNTGAVYLWKNSPDNCPLVDLPVWLLALMNGEGIGENIPPVDNPPVILSSLSSSVLSVTPTVASLIASTQPTAAGQRHRKLFDLARGLKALPEYAEADASIARDILKAWHQLARPIIGTKAWEDTWGDFIETWSKVKHPAGTGPLAEAVARAKQSPLPPEAELYDSSDTRLLLSVCRELQRTHGAEPFYLACRTASETVGMNHNTASQRLKMFIADGLIELAVKNTTRKASRYRYLGVMD